MTRVLSKSAPVFDTSSAGFRCAAGDLGEVLAHLAGGLRPDPETLSRLCLSLRLLQGFLLEEAEQQEAREALHRAFDFPLFSSPPPFAGRIPVAEAS